MKAIQIVCVIAITMSWSMCMAGITAGTTIQITDQPGRQRTPSISGDMVVWSDNRNGIYDIYAHDLSTGLEFPIATGGENKYYPQISGSVVVWHEGDRPVTIRGVDIDTGHTFVVQSGIYNFQGSQYHTIADRSVYYALEERQRYIIYGRNIDTLERTRISPDDGGSYTDPDARDGYLVWRDHPYQHILDIDSGARTRVRVTLGGPEDPGVVSEDTIFFIGDSKRVRSYDILTGGFAEVSTASAIYPAADGSIVIWTDLGLRPSPGLSGCDISTGEIFNIVTIPGGGVMRGQQETEIDGMRVVWTRSSLDFSDMDIFVTELVPEPATLGMVLVGAMAMIRKRRRS